MVITGDSARDVAIILFGCVGVFVVFFVLMALFPPGGSS
jgi:hypothetical protein